MVQQQPDHWAELKRFIRTQTILPRLILINGGVWLFASVILVFGFLFNVPDTVTRGGLIDILALPASLDGLIVRPWTLITYMFFHLNFFHILFNMLWLYWFGRIFLQFLGTRQLLATYIFGGLAGGALFIFFYNVFPVFREALPAAQALGASASVMAVVTAISFYVPSYTIHLLFIGRVKILYIAIILFILDFFMIRSNNAGGHIAHIGGAIYGFIFATSMLKGRDFSRLLDSLNLKGLRKFFYKKKEAPTTERDFESRPYSDDEYNYQKVKQQDKIDNILDKISKSGYDSLTKEEKEFLFRSSNRK